MRSSNHKITRLFFWLFFCFGQKWKTSTDLIHVCTIMTSSSPYDIIIILQHHHLMTSSSYDIITFLFCPVLQQDAMDEIDFQPCGMLLLGLKFNPTSPSSSPRRESTTRVQTIGTLHVLIKQAKELPSLGPNGETNCFVKSYLLPNKSYGSKKKTKVVEKSLNPEWQEEITYKFLSLSELRSERALEMTLWDNDRRGTNEFLGCVRIGPNPKRVRTPKDWMDSTGEEISHWEAMLTRPGEWVEKWHTLRASTDHPGDHKLAHSLTRIPQTLPPPTPQDEASDKITPLNSPTHNTGERSNSLGETPKKGRGHKRSGSEDTGRGRSSTLPTRGKSKSGSSISASVRFYLLSLINCTSSLIGVHM